MQRAINISTHGIRTALLLSVMSLVHACGQERQVGEVKKGNSDGTAADVPCKEASCPKVVMSISANPIQNGKLVGSVIGKEPWTILGSAQGGGLRDIRMKAYNPPAGGEFVGQGTKNIQTKYTASEPVEGQIPIGVVIRDVSRCKHDRPGNDAACENLDQQGLEDFEVKGLIPWSIIDGDVNSIADPSFTQLQSVPQGANAGATGCVNGFLPGAIQGVLTGSIIGGIFKGTMGCIGNNMGQLGQ